MSSFARASFDVAGYLASRPSYPPRIIDIVLKYHTLNGGRFERAVDVGCGPGFLALSLAPHFRDTLALDPAAKMVQIGLQPEESTGKKIRYAVGTAEKLGEAGVGEGEEGVDLVIAGQAAHWFNHAATWKELSKRVRSGGTVAYLGYGEMILPTHPRLSPLISAHSQFFWSGGYWQAGRAIVEGLLDDVPFPVPASTLNSSAISAGREALLQSLPPLDPTLGHPVSDNSPSSSLPPDLASELETQWDAGTAVRLKSDIDSDTDSHPPSAPASTDPTSIAPQVQQYQWLMRKTFKKPSLEGYFRTWSALHAYHEAEPADAAKRGKGKQGDVVDRLIQEIWTGREKEGERGGEGEGEIEGAWPLVLMMSKKK